MMVNYAILHRKNKSVRKVLGLHIDVIYGTGLQCKTEGGEENEPSMEELFQALDFGTG